jgi:hypothetical protein
MRYVASPARWLRRSPWVNITSLILPSSISASPTVVWAPRSQPGCFRLADSDPNANISQVVLTSADGDAYLSKPSRSADLLRGLKIVAEIVATGKALPPFPQGLQVLQPATAPPAVAA